MTTQTETLFKSFTQTETLLIRNHNTGIREHISLNTPKGTFIETTSQQMRLTAHLLRQVH